MALLVYHSWKILYHSGKNKALQVENQQLKEQVQLFQNQLVTAENTIERIKGFTTRLRTVLEVDAQEMIPRVPFLRNNRNFPQKKIKPTLLSFFNSTSLTHPQLIPVRYSMKKPPFSLSERILNLTEDASQTEAMLQKTYKTYQKQNALARALPTIMPVAGTITSHYGKRICPFRKEQRMHQGLDIANPIGTLVRAPGDATVSFVGRKRGYGLTLKLRHTENIETLYAHLNEVLVSRNKVVRKGENIAKTGNTGNSTGPHLHYEIRIDGRPIDPRTYLIHDFSPPI